MASYKKYSYKSPRNHQLAEHDQIRFRNAATSSEVTWSEKLWHSAADFLSKLFIAYSIKKTGDGPDGTVDPATLDEVSLTEKLWHNTADIRKKVLNTNFIKKISDGTLDPVKFGQYMVQDAVYCYDAKETLDKMAERTKGGKFGSFFKQESENYKSYYEDLFKDWSIGEPSGIHLNSAVTEYIDHLRQVASSKPPVYYFVASLPCPRLWPWIGVEINSGRNAGVYQKWVADNFAGSGYHVLEEKVNTLEIEVDYELAETIYRKSMMCEYNFFDSVDPQE